MSGSHAYSLIPPAGWEVWAGRLVVWLTAPGPLVGSRA